MNEKVPVNVVKLTDRELRALRACVAGELDNDDGMAPQYFNPLRRVAHKLATVKA